MALDWIHSVRTSMSSTTGSKLTTPKKKKCEYVNDKKIGRNSCDSTGQVPMERLYESPILPAKPEEQQQALTI